MEWVESRGRSIDDAKEAALDRLGVHEDDAEFDVLTDARVGWFGRVKEDARVRARVRPTAPRAKDDRRRGRGRDRRGTGRGSGQRGSTRSQSRRTSKAGRGTAGAEGAGRETAGAEGGSRETAGAEGGGRETAGAEGAGRETAGAEGGGRDQASGNRTGAKRTTKDDPGRETRVPGEDRADSGRGAKEHSEGSRDQSRSGERGARNRSRGKGSAPRAAGTKEERSVTDHAREPSLSEQAELAEEFVAGLAAKFGTPLSFSRDELKDGVLRIEATGDDIGVLVGRKGATAQAIDDLVRTVLQRAGGTTREGKIRVDIGGVRARRAVALADFTRMIAAQVLESGDETVLEPMGGADRKMVHDVVNDIDGVDTRSEGEDPHRRVVIVPASSES